MTREEMMRKAYLDEYIRRFGSTDLIATRWISINPYTDVYDVYRDCVEQNKTWRELLNIYDDLNKDILL